MKREAILGVLTGINLVLLLGIGVTQVLPAIAQGTPGPLRGNGLEIIDGAGRVRASIGIQPAAEGASETVLFRLIHPNGQPSVKIGASLTGAGLSFVGGDDASYIILEAEGPETQLRLVEQEGREQVLAP
ncbi:hypothetical protein VW23_014890 [Devosia insulae DS-56]|uniref:Uncharacterized protein n=1 Tax=Devosia insulae DS-56 TaxID=1116389 RepID=A0A1E5XT56_9HYPH|nr:hypothetical protein [Devosia insulae]OEO31735.1 hypothetical protein VW23_014890 [Devosia insulae DS-56]